MTTQSLHTAISAIKKGDKQRGKEILTGILQEEPDNDNAWLWMSAVVKTVDLRRECLEEALKHNPNNEMAQKGLRKINQKHKKSPVANKNDTVSPSLQKITPQPKQESTAPTANLSKTSQEYVEYFCKRFILEKGYIIHTPINDDNSTVPGLNLDNFLFPVPVDELPELVHLQKHFDFIFFRQTGAGFGIICLKVCGNKNEPAPIKQSKLVEVGQECLKYSTAVAYGVVSPVQVQIIELYERGFTKHDQKRLKSLKRIPGGKKVGIQVHAIDMVSNNIPFSASALASFNSSKRYIQRLLDEKNSFSEEKLLIALASSSIEFLPILAGIILGVVLALSSRLIANVLNWQYYGAIDYMIGFLVASVAIYLPKFKLKSHWQGFLACTGYGIFLYAILWLLIDDAHSSIGFFYFVPIIFLALLGRFLGAIAEP